MNRQFTEPRYIMHTDRPGICRQCATPIYTRDAVFTAVETPSGFAAERFTVAFHKTCWEELVCRQIVKEENA